MTGNQVDEISALQVESNVQPVDPRCMDAGVRNVAYVISSSLSTMLRLRCVATVSRR